LPARIVVYRRPVETIARGSDPVDVVHEVMVEQVALLLGVDPDEVDPERR
jgi:predicted Zn-dependent protease with MMP-like domain